MREGEPVGSADLDAVLVLEPDPALARFVGGMWDNPKARLLSFPTMENFEKFEEVVNKRKLQKQKSDAGSSTESLMASEVPDTPQP
jgi:hypothetical protein